MHHPCVTFRRSWEDPLLFSSFDPLEILKIIHADFLKVILCLNCTFDCGVLNLVRTVKKSQFCMGPVPILPVLVRVPYLGGSHNLSPHCIELSKDTEQDGQLLVFLCLLSVSLVTGAWTRILLFTEKQPFERGGRGF